MRVDVLRGDQLMPCTRAEIARFRHRVFIEKLGWQVNASSSCPTPNEGEETDEYDHDETIYITIRGTQDAIVGCARLLPAKNRYLLGDHFRHLVDDLPAATHVAAASHASPAMMDNGEFTTPVWELSRFAWDRPESEVMPGGGGDGKQGARELLRAAVFTAQALGAHRLIGVTFVSLARLFVQLGVPTQKLGAAYRIDGRWVAAYRIDIDRVTLGALGLLGVMPAAADPVASTSPWRMSGDVSDVIPPAKTLTQLYASAT
ncbi:Acyl-homoserine-lactone synthase [Pandoraea anhela]|uniref:Acyl-homoserine-lactone synthase n=2 Tax=Pandoraea anhela TaxID=2508295 RepID=A0A5E4T767_9BURK|nr:Acyl-homoserine-lactone synthase [Pandoraea anhela]